MNTAETVLVIILAVAFFILLLLLIALVVIITGILRNIRRITQKAEETTESFSDLAVMIGKRVGPIALSAAAAAALRRFKSPKK